MPPMGHPPLKKGALPLKTKAPTKTPKNQKLRLIFVFHSKNNTGKRWQKSHTNVIFSLEAFKIS